MILRSSGTVVFSPLKPYNPTMKNRTESSHAETPEQLVEQISRLMNEAEAMLSGPVTEQASSQIADIKERLETVRDQLGAAYGRAKKTVVAGAKRTDEAIRTHPYESLAVALGVGVLLGALICRNKD